MVRAILSSLLTMIGVAACSRRPAMGPLGQPPEAPRLRGVTNLPGITVPNVTIDGAIVKVSVPNGDYAEIPASDLATFPGEPPPSPGDIPHSLRVIQATVEGLFAGGDYDKYRLRPGMMAALLKKVTIYWPVRQKAFGGDAEFTDLVFVGLDGKLLGIAGLTEIGDQIKMACGLEARDLTKLQLIGEKFPVMSRQAAIEAASQVSGYSTQSLENLQPIDLSTSPPAGPFLFYWADPTSPGSIMVRSDGKIFRATSGQRIQDIGPGGGTMQLTQIGVYKPPG